MHQPPYAFPLELSVRLRVMEGMPRDPTVTAPSLIGGATDTKEDGPPDGMLLVGAGATTEAAPTSMDTVAAGEESGVFTLGTDPISNSDQRTWESRQIRRNEMADHTREMARQPPYAFPLELSVRLRVMEGMADHTREMARDLQVLHPVVQGFRTNSGQQDTPPGYQYHPLI
jgi:hypothetical protein